MTVYFILKFLHILGAIVILGTGAGIAFFTLIAHRSGNVALIAATTDTVLLADFVFMASAIVIQPFTGGFLMEMSSTATNESWMVASLVLYLLAGLLWLPVLLMQIEIRNLARRAASDGTAMPERYALLFRRALWFGAPGFVMMLAILWLMIAKP